MTLLYILRRVPLSTARILNILKAQTNSFSITKKERKSALQTTNGKKRERRKRRRTDTTTTTTENVSLDASSVRSPRRERVRGPKRGAVFGTEKLESKCDYVGIRFRARV